MSIDFQLKRDVLLAFTTPITQVRVGEAAAINPPLKAEILRRSAEEKGQVRSNVGGWHSGDDIFDWPVDGMSVLKESAEQAVTKMAELVNQSPAARIEQTLRGWANVCRSGHYHKPHSHATYHWSGVYYVDTGTVSNEHPQSGTLEFQDPRGAVEMAGMPGNPFGRSIAVRPQSGMIVIFPSWLLHWVNPYQGDEPRISIAFNSRVDLFRKA
jgi:uncharacterized protein (TIGR02466 family)